MKVKYETFVINNQVKNVDIIKIPILHHYRKYTSFFFNFLMALNMFADYSLLIENRK